MIRAIEIDLITPKREQPWRCPSVAHRPEYVNNPKIICPLCWVKVRIIAMQIKKARWALTQGRT